MQVQITGVVADSAAAAENGRIEFSQAQRLDNGDLLITQSFAVAQVIAGELRKLNGEPFTLPSNPDGTAVRIREIFGGRTFEWWTAVPEVDLIEYRLLPVVESSSVPASVFGPPPWLIAAEAARDAIAQSVADGTAVIDAMGGLAGIQDLVNEASSSASTATDAASSASQAASDAAVSAAAAADAAASVDTDAINARFDEVDYAIENEAGRPDLISSFRSPLYIAHRGGRHVYPEHSIEAYRKAFESGYSPEADVQALADGTLVCIHDLTTGRTMTGADMTVASMTREQWISKRVLPPSNGDGIGYAYGTPMFFDDYLDMFGGNVLLFPEVKSVNAVDGVIEAIKARKLEKAVVLSSFDWGSAVRFVEAGIYATIAGPTQTAQQCVDAGFIGAVFNGSTTGDQRITEFKTAGLKVLTYTQNSLNTAADQIARGADGVYTDDPWGVDPNATLHASIDLSEGWLIPAAKFNIQDPAQGRPTVNMNSLRMAGNAGASRTAVMLRSFGKGNNNVKLRFKVEAEPAVTGTASASWLFGFYMGKQGFGDEPVNEAEDSIFRLVIMRANGQVSVFRKDAPGATATRADGQLFNSELLAADGSSRVYDFEVELTGSNVYVRELVSNQRVQIPMASVPGSDHYVTLANNRLVSRFSDISFIH